MCSCNKTFQYSNCVLTVQGVSLSGLKCPASYYCIAVPVSNGTQTRIFLISEKLASRLWKKFSNVTCHANRASEGASAEHGRCEGSNNCTVMPGEHSLQFLSAVIDSVARKYETNQILPNWIALSGLYKLWLLIAHVTTELFADCFNESGVLVDYCTVDDQDKALGALGSWEHVDEMVEGGAGNPPFQKDLIARMLRRFERKVHGTNPYCRIVILPLGKTYGVLKHVSSLTSEGVLLFSAPAGSFPFMNQQVLLSRGHLKPKACLNFSVGIFAWTNREYVVKHRLPADIEELYLAWPHHYLQKSADFVVHRDVFVKAFPPELRSSERSLPTYVRQVLETSQ